MAAADDSEFGQVLQSLSGWLLNIGLNVTSEKFNQKSEMVSAILKNELFYKYAQNCF